MKVKVIRQSQGYSYGYGSKDGNAVGLTSILDQGQIVFQFDYSNQLNYFS